VTVSVFSAAERLGKKSGWNLTNLQMQKMLYIAHMFYMGDMGEPLIHEHFEAWDYGPVQPSLYHHLKTFGADPVPDFAFDIINSIDEDDPCIPYLDFTVTRIKRGRLVAITHWGKGAWNKNYDKDARATPIPDEHILEEYKARKEYAEKKRQKQ